jgi:hypothetical protein
MHADDPIRNLIRSAARAAHDTPAPSPDLAPVRRSIRPAPRLGLRATAVAGTIATILTGVLIVRGQLNRPSERLVTSAADDGLTFPVDQPYSYVDTYGAERMTGTEFQHLHQGVDIFAEKNTPVRAVQDGEVFSVGVANLSGNRLWLRTTSGDCYYYAHLNSFGEAISQEAPKDLSSKPVSRQAVNDSLPETIPPFQPPTIQVTKGTILGFVGTSGNAAGTPPHLHFEIHPKCDAPVNPAPILNAINLFDGWALPFPDQPFPDQKRLARAIRGGVIARVRSVQFNDGIAEFPTLSIELKTDLGDCVTYLGISGKDVSVAEQAIVQAGTAIGTTTLNPVGAAGIELRPGCKEPVDPVAVVKAIADKDRQALSAALDPQNSK